MNIFHDGDRICLIADHILLKGHKGTITRWVHDGVYIITMDNGRSIVLKDNEMRNITMIESHEKAQDERDRWDAMCVPPGG